MRRCHPDVLLLDLVMPGRSGIEVLPEIARVAPDTRVLVLSMQDDPVYVREAFAAGASGYLVKEVADAELVPAIREVASGKQYVEPLLGGRLAAAYQEAARPTRCPTGSTRYCTYSRSDTQTRRSQRCS